MDSSLSTIEEAVKCSPSLRYPHTAADKGLILMIPKIDSAMSLTGGADLKTGGGDAYPA